MALDTLNKRAGAQAFLWNPIMPSADGTIDQSDRQQVVGVYPGVTAGEAVLATLWARWQDDHHHYRKP